MFSLQGLNGENVMNNLLVIRQIDNFFTRVKRAPLRDANFDTHSSDISAEVISEVIPVSEERNNTYMLLHYLRVFECHEMIISGTPYLADKVT